MLLLLVGLEGLAPKNEGGLVLSELDVPTNPAVAVGGVGAEYGYMGFDCWLELR